MKQVSAAKYVEGVESIYVEQPTYETGHDGSDGKCDCIGMCRGGLKRAGATDVTNMRGTNQAARKTIRNLQKLQSSVPLCVGDVVLKTRDKDDANMPLPDKYRKGGSEYDPVVGETNFTHIGTVTQQNPLVITHMTSPTAKKDKSIKNWTWFGELPWVMHDPSPSPEPQPVPQPGMALVVAPSGSTVKMRQKPSVSCKLYWDVPIGSIVTVIEWGDDWSHIEWDGKTGYMMTGFLQPIGVTETYTVVIPGLTEQQADKLISQYPGAYKEVERG